MARCGSFVDGSTAPYITNIFSNVKNIDLLNHFEISYYQMKYWEAPHSISIYFPLPMHLKHLHSHPLLDDKP